MPPQKKQNNQHKRNYLLTSKQQNTVSIVPILHGEQQKKNGKKNLKLVFHLSISPTTIHVVKLIPCLTSKHNDDKQMKNGDSHAI